MRADDHGDEVCPSRPGGAEAPAPTGVVLDACRNDPGTRELVNHYHACYAELLELGGSPDHDAELQRLREAVRRAAVACTHARGKALPAAQPSDDPGD